jgi:hypothetical protein
MRESLEECGIRHCEDSGVDPNAERQRRDGDSGEGLSLKKLA